MNPYILLIIMLVITYSNVNSFRNTIFKLKLLKTTSIKDILTSDFTSTITETLPTQNYPLTISLLSLTGIALLTKLGIYWRMQYEIAQILGNIPKNYKIVEFDAQDGKNIFYLPSGSDYTAIMTVNEKDIKKYNEKLNINEQLILECIGKVNRNDLNIIGRVRTSTNQVLPQSVDCIISINSLKRSGAFPLNLIQEAYR